MKSPSDMTSTQPITKIYGWFHSAEQTIPSYDPPHDAPCPFCSKPIHADDVRTHSIMWDNERKRSYFYRTHRTCAVASEHNMDGVVWDMIEHNGD